MGVTVHRDRDGRGINLPNGTSKHWTAEQDEDFIEIDGASLHNDERQALLAQGGIEDHKKPWYLRRDIPFISITQYDSISHNYRPKHSTAPLARPCDGIDCDDEHCQHVIMCSSPACQRAFEQDWRIAHPPINAASAATMFRGYVVPGNPLPTYAGVAPPMAAPNPAHRPPTIAEWEAAQMQAAGVGEGVRMAEAFASKLAELGVKVAPQPQ